MAAASAEFYGLEHDPFARGSMSCRDRFESEDFKEMSSMLTWLARERGFGLFTGPPGTGKTFCLHCFYENRDAWKGRMAYIPHSTVTVRDFYKVVCYHLGLPAAGGKPKLFKAVQDQILRLDRIQQPLILVIDDAQLLHTAVLRDLKLLMNQIFDSRDCFTLILVGEPVLNVKLSSPYYESLNQRISVHYNFRGLSREEVSCYLNHKIRLAGGREGIIAPEAAERLAEISAGRPKVIDRTMSYALKLGCQLEKSIIDRELIDDSVEGLMLK